MLVPVFKWCLSLPESSCFTGMFHNRTLIGSAIGYEGASYSFLLICMAFFLDERLRGDGTSFYLSTALY
jgi:hypothetical protein